MSISRWSHGRLQRACQFQVESLERRVLLSSAIAAFNTQQIWPVGSQPRAVAMADVNLDGKPDLLVANAQSNTVSVLLGNGNGSFQNQLTFAAGANPIAIAVANVNGSWPDLIVADNGGNSVSLLMGNGNGTFQSPVTLAAGAAPRAIAVADLNGDGRPDLVVANYGANSVSVLLGIGGGTFQAQQTFATGSQPRSIAITDLNLDGKPDLVIANHGSNSVSVLLGKGDGSFQPQQTYATGAVPFSVTTADLNLDGKPDVVVANNGSNTAGVLLGTGTGTLQPQQTIASGLGPIAVAASDVNGDGKPDLIVANYNAGNVGVDLGNGDGTFQAQKVFPTAGSPRAVAVADLNDDGRLDLVTANSNVNNVSVLLGDIPPHVVSINRASPGGTDATGDIVSYTVTFSEPVTGVDASDFQLVLSGVTVANPPALSGSGAVYTVTISGIAGGGTLGLNLVDNGSIENAAGNPLQPGGAAAFGPQQTIAVGSEPTSVVVADLNGDGIPDLVVNNFQSRSVGVLLGNGNGTFQPQQTFAAGILPASVAVADVNGDGKPDLLVVNGGEHGNVGVLLGNGNGTFQPQQTFNVGTNPVSIATLDVNGDGKTDLAVVNNGSSDVSILLGNGNGTFQAQSRFNVGIDAYPTSVAVVGFDGDSEPGLAVVSNENNYVIIVGGFRTLATGRSPVGIAAADVNGDGKPDLVVANYGDYSVGVFLGNSSDTFLPQQTFATGQAPLDVAVEDVNGDGKLDVVVSNGRSSSVSVLLGNGDGTFQAPQTFATRAGPESVAVSDLNRDGRPDLVVVNDFDNTLSVLLGNSTSSFTGETYNILPPEVTAINGSAPASAIANADSVIYTVTFSKSVSGVSASDFQVITTGSVVAGGLITVSGSGASYNVKINGIHGSGTLQLELVDNDSIVSDTTPLGGVGIGNGSFIGQTYTILQAGPALLSINRFSAPTAETSASSVSFSVTFSEPVTGVDASDFATVTNGVTVGAPLSLIGSGASYVVTVSNITGTGTLGLNLVSNGNIRNFLGNPLQPPAPAAFSSLVSLSNGISSAAVADVNGDGIADLVETYSSGSIAVELGNGNGTFAPPRTSLISSDFPSDIAVADVNGDGIPDAIVAQFHGNRVSVLLGDGNGTFAAGQTFATGRYPVFLTVADVNGDGRPDIIAVNQQSSDLSILLGNGNGTFQAQQNIAVVNAAANIPGRVQVADLNGDGKADLVLANYNYANVAVMLGNGNGTFQPEQALPTSNGPSDVAIGDFNNDGKLDVAASTLGSVNVFLGNGDGTFQPRHTFKVDYGVRTIFAADLNGDGKEDLIIGKFPWGIPSPTTIGVLLGNGDGSFASQQTNSIPADPGFLTVADLNLDGRLDIVTDSTTGLGVLLGNSNADFVGQTYTIVPLVDKISAENFDISLALDPDREHIDWTLNTVSFQIFVSGGQMAINDPNGLSINSIGGSDLITLDYTNGNPLPDTLHLNGAFTIDGLEGSNPLAGKTVEIGRSTVLISYQSLDPVGAIKNYLRGGYNNGAWNGSPTALTGVITSAAAQANPNHNTGIGDADFADGRGVNTTANTVELKYTLYGDANLDGHVNSADLQVLLFGLNKPGAWDQGDFNYDGQVNSADLQSLLFTLNTSLGSQATPMAVVASPTAVTASNAATSGSGRSRSPLSSVPATVPTTPSDHFKPTKRISRKRR